ncbi:MAG TPA: trypsin-like peptidase domain-containing protein [Polyangiaceae bacterium]|nr:trypsin-like peptidase domain-containing protein [Polyangiaceae bacterium]
MTRMLLATVTAAMGIAALPTACRKYLPHELGGAESTELPPGATAVTPADPELAPRATAEPPPKGALAVGAGPVSFAPIAHAADPSVVTITTVNVEVSPFTHLARGGVRGLGTGFVVDKNGVVLTNNHVVEGADAIQVKLFDDRELPAKVVATDAPTDIAVIRIDAKDLRPLPFGDSDATDVGDWVVAIGNPFGLAHTVSAGIISAKGRTLEDAPLDSSGYYSFLQTDASINPGNSGGPLLNLRGEVVGINTAIRGGGAQGIGFAIPINMVKQLLPMLLRDGHFTRSALGLRIADAHDLSSEDRSALGLAGGSRLTGAVVEYVVAGGPADRGKLRPGDLIVAFEGRPIEHSAQLRWLASTAGVGRSVVVRIQRGNKQFDLPLTLGRLPEEPAPSLQPELER